MPTGQPIALKCPKCRRGKHGYSPRDRGVQAIVGVAQHREVARNAPRARFSARHAHPLPRLQPRMVV